MLILLNSFILTRWTRSRSGSCGRATGSSLKADRAQSNALQGHFFHCYWCPLLSKYASMTLQTEKSNALQGHFYPLCHIVSPCFDLSMISIIVNGLPQTKIISKRNIVKCEHGRGEPSPRYSWYRLGNAARQSLPQGKFR